MTLSDRLIDFRLFPTPLGSCTDKKFKYFDTFDHHLEFVHGRKFKCAYCETLIRNCCENEVRNHLKSHNYAEFQCLHCNSGFDDVNAIGKHMSLEHASQFLVVAARQSKSNMVYIGDRLDASEFFKYKCKCVDILSHLNPKLEAHLENKNNLNMSEVSEDQMVKLVASIIQPIDFAKAAELIVGYGEYENERSKVQRQVEVWSRLKRMSHSINPGTKPKSLASFLKMRHTMPASATMSEENRNTNVPAIAYEMSNVAIEMTDGPNGTMNIPSGTMNIPNACATTIVSADIDFSMIDASMTDTPVIDDPMTDEPVMDDPMEGDPNDIPTVDAVAMDTNVPGPSTAPGMVIATTATETPRCDGDTVATFRCKCIDENTAKEIMGVRGMRLKNLSCSTCQKIIEVDGEDGLIPYLDHLDEHSKCFEAQTQKEMLKHRVEANEHANSPIAFIVIEKSSAEHVQRLVRCTFECSMCSKICETATGLKNHFYSRHIDCVIDACIKEEISVIYSADRTLAIASLGEPRYKYCQLFHCPDAGHQFSGSRSDAIEHHTRFHAKGNEPFSTFNFQLKTSIIPSERYVPGWGVENHKKQRMHLFECLNCNAVFESIEQASEHRNHPSETNDNRCKMGFVVKKLMACSGCKMISTFQNIVFHSCDSSKVPVNALNYSHCAFCIRKKDGKLVSHYRNAHACIHATGDPLSPGLFDQLNLNADIFNATFSPGCCLERNYRYDQLEHLVAHTSKCCFRCNTIECDDYKTEFNDLKSMVEHYVRVHKATATEIIEAWHSTKRIFNEKPLNLRIVLANGLVTKSKSILDEHFIEEHSPNLMNLIQFHVWQKEVDVIKKTAEELGMPA